MKRSSWSLGERVQQSGNDDGGRSARHLPLGCLATSDVCCGLLGLLAEACSAVRVLLADGLEVGEVLRAVDDGDEGADDRPVGGHVGVDAGGVGDVERVALFSRHDDGKCGDEQCRVGPVEGEVAVVVGYSGLFTWGGDVGVAAQEAADGGAITNEGRGLIRE